MKKTLLSIAIGGTLAVSPVGFIHNSFANSTREAKLINSINSKINELIKLSKTAQTKGYDIKREQATIFMARQFANFAKYDSAHIKENAKIFGYSYIYKKRNPKRLARELPTYERTEILKMLTTSISNINDVIAGRSVRKPVNMVDWKNVRMKNEEFYNPNGKPVFLYDYFSKAHDAEDKHPNVYNDYVGDLANSWFLSLNLLKENGKLDLEHADNLINFEKKFPNKKDHIGYVNGWKGLGALPQWMRDKYGLKNLTHGGAQWTAYDIDNPHIRDAWRKTFSLIIPKLKGKNFAKLSYVIANEPQWTSDDKSWFKVKNGISVDTLTKFRTWLKNKHHGSIKDLNSLWKTSYKSFDDITIKIPFTVAKIRGSAKFYDWSRFNMYRVDNWMKFLHDNIKKHDSRANTSIKILPELTVGELGGRDNGINIEDLTNLTEISGHDSAIRTKNFDSKHEEWQKNYAYYWREVAMTNDLLRSFAPNKVIFNSESHFISTSHFRNAKMKPTYVRSAYWLSAILGTSANTTWFWARYGTGEIEPRVIHHQAASDAYQGSVVQMPRVANEITQTMFDLNAHSQDIVKFHKQEKPIRVFYSETSNINYQDQINQVFNIYKGLYFDGSPIGFATQNILNKHIGKFSEVIVYNTPSVTDDEFKALQNYLNHGGTVITDNASLKVNEYKQARKVNLKQARGKLIIVKHNTKEIPTIRNLAFKILPKSKKPAITIKETNATKTKGCIWRVVNGSDRHNKIVTVINVGKTTAHLTMIDPNNSPKATNIVDMFTGQKRTQHINLEPEKVLFLNVGTKKPWAKIK